MTYEVKRCPFCNTHDLTMDVSNVYSVRCYECGSMGPHAIHSKDAVEQWNRGLNGSTALVNLPPGKSNRNDMKKVDL